MQALVTGSSNTAVTWSAAPVVTGATLGAGSSPASSGISTNTYAAPANISSAQTVTVTAKSVADTTKSASVTIALATAPTVIDVGTGAPTGGLQQAFVSA